MKAGLPTDAQTQQDGSSQAAGDGSAETSPGPGFTPPEPAELAEQFPHLEILELLGQGGMGAVYKARQKHLDRLVALKILPPQIGQTEAFAQRFTREARSLAKLNHPHIVIVHDFGTTETGLYYFIMEFVDGTDLRQVIRTQQLSPAAALVIVPQICEALQFAHDEGIVHRDIKPENVLLDKKGRVKIADFGLAKLLGKPATVYALTQAGQRMGTPQYMAPEQIEHPDQVDHRADIYSLGVVFYEMLTGELPLGRFAAPSRKVHVDVRLDQVVLKTLEKEPELRYQQASEVQTEVETISSDGQAERPAGKGPAAPRDEGSERIRRRVWIPAVGLLVGGGINCLGIVAMVLGTLAWLIEGGLLTEGFLAFIPWVGTQLILALMTAQGVLVVRGGWNLLHLGSHRRAVIGAGAAVLPFFPGALLSLPVGIWALMLLSKEEVKAVFGGQAMEVAIPPKIRKFAASATEEIKAAFDQGKAEIKKVVGEKSAETQDSDTAAHRKSRKMIIASFVLSLISILIASVNIPFAVKFAYGFLTVFFAVFLGVMAIKNITSYRQHLLHTGFGVAAIFFASLGLIRLLAAIF
jgi:tRNA A-37 threonylcarbamoyl transferase component Bud32